MDFKNFTLKFVKHSGELKDFNRGMENKLWIKLGNYFYGQALKTGIIDLWREHF